MDYKRNAKYFEPPKHITRFVIISWLILLILAIGLLASKNFLGIIPAAILVLWIFLMFYNPKPSDEEIDEQAGSLAKGLREKALKKLGLEEEEVGLAPPILLVGYCFDNVLRDEANSKAWYIRGADSLWRASEVTLTAFFFTENQVYFYQRIASLVSDAVKESTNEVYYKDIVSVKTEEKEQAFVDPGTGEEDKTRRTRYTRLIVRNTGAEEIGCSCRKNDEADEAVKAFRNLLKMKKTA